MRQKATRSEASGAIVEYMGAIVRAWPRHAEQSTFTPLVEAVTLPWQFTVLFVLTILHINPPQYQIAKMNMAAIFIRQYFEHVLIEKMNND